MGSTLVYLPLLLLLFYVMDRIQAKLTSKHVIFGISSGNILLTATPISFHFSQLRNYVDQQQPRKKFLLPIYCKRRLPYVKEEDDMDTFSSCKSLKYKLEVQSPMQGEKLNTILINFIYSFLIIMSQMLLGF